VSRLLDLFRTRASRAGGRVGAIVVGADGGEAFAIGADEPMFAASVIKLPIVMTLYADADEGRVSLDEQVPVGARLGGSGVLRDLRDVDRMSLRDLAVLAMTVSDNTATNRLIERIGMERVNQRLEEWGCPVTRLRRLLFDWEARSRGLENLMTARECASLLSRVVAQAASGSTAGKEVRTILERNGDLTRLGRYLPKGVTLGHKDGWGDDPDPVDNDAGVITAARSVIVAGLTFRIATVEARSLLGLLGLAAAELAGADVGTLPSEVVGSA
jgi:beta-lactamase class A